MISTVILATQLTFLQSKLFLMVLGKLKFRASNEILENQKQRSRGVLRKRCFEKMQQIYMKTPMTKCDFNHYSAWVFSVNLLHIFRKPFPKNTSGRLLLENQLTMTRTTIETLDRWPKSFSTKIFVQGKHKTDNFSDKNCKFCEIFGSKLYFCSGKPSKLLETANSYKIFQRFYRNQRLTDI